jgi:hypothetical protein
MKFIAITEQNTRESGVDKDTYILQINEMYFQRFGKHFEHRMCFEYLQKKPKWLSYVASEKQDQQQDKKQPPRPIGKKSAQAKAKEGQVVKEAVAAAAKTIAEASGVSRDYSSRDKFYDAVASAITNMEEREYPEDLRAELCRERAMLKLEEIWSKRRRLLSKVEEEQAIATNAMVTVEESIAEFELHQAASALSEIVILPNRGAQDAATDDGSYDSANSNLSCE